ncbi:MAG: hypothetical protein L6428_13970 [Candidatus Aminicenantes bacterium]|nr:hypothetical protein [Candidatus Aminicenantes bacterium]
MQRILLQAAFALGLLLFLGACGSGSATSTPGPSTPSGLSFQAWSLYGAVNSLASEGDDLYVSTNAFVSVDAHAPASPAIRGHFRPRETGIPGSTVIRNGVAYVAWGETKGLWILDLSDKGNPRLLSRQETRPFDAREVRLTEDLLCVLAVDNTTTPGMPRWAVLTLRIAGDPGHPRLQPEGTFDLGPLGIYGGLPRSDYVHDFHADGGHLYLTTARPRQENEPAKLHILDVSSRPAQPVFVSTTSFANVDSLRTIPYLEMAQHGNLLLINGPFLEPGQGWSVVKVVDIQDPHRVQVLGGWSPAVSNGKTLYKLAVSGNRAFATDSARRFLSFDVSDPTHPGQLAAARLPMPEDHPAREFRIHLSGGRAFLYFADYYAVMVFDVSREGLLPLLSEIPFGHAHQDVSAEGTRVYAAVWDWMQLYTLDPWNGTPGHVLQRTPVWGSAWGIKVMNGRAYMAMGASTVGDSRIGGLHVFELGSPDRLLAQVPAREPVMENVDVDVDVQNGPGRNLAYVVVGQPHAFTEERTSVEPGLRIIDLDENPPREIGFCPFAPDHPGGAPPQGRAVHKPEGIYAYVAAKEAGLLIVDVSDPSQPREVVRWHAEGSKNIARGISVSGNLAGLAVGNAFVLLDLRDFPQKPPTQSARIELGESCQDVILAGQRAFVLSTGTLWVFDISNPTAPDLLAKDSGGFEYHATRMDVSGEWIHVMAAGLHTFRWKD